MDATGADRILEAVGMTPAESETQRLRELHEFYVWQVNAAVEEGRDDLVAELAEEYFEVALAELATTRPADIVHDRPDDRLEDWQTGAQPTDVRSAGSGWEVVESRPAPVPWWRRLLAR